MARMLIPVMVVFLVAICVSKPPNIIFLMTDSMDGRNMDPTHAQYSLMNMPNLRQIANQGTQFVNTYTNAPICVTGRSCLFTGRRIDNNKAFNNGMGFGMASDGVTVDSNCVHWYNETTCRQTFGALQALNYTLVDAMQDIGYDVFLYGKVDVGANILNQPFAGNGTADGFHGGAQLILTTRSVDINRVSMENPNDLVNDTDNNVYPNDWQMSYNCVDKLNQLAADRDRRANHDDDSVVNEDTKPFFLYCSMNIPHPDFDTNQTWLDQVDVDSIPLPQWPAEGEFHPFDKYMSIIKNVWGNFTDDQIQAVRKTYYAMNVEADYILGLVINASIANGYDLNNTVFVYTSDHGEMNMEHRQIWKNSMYEGSTRIPLFFSGPGVGKKIVSDFTQIIDILPTLIAVGGGNVPSFLDGYSLTQYFDEYEKYDEVHPDYITAQYHARNGPTGSFMVRRGSYKYIQFGHTLSAYKNFTAQLFDLDADPQELTNLGCSAKYKNVCDEMESILADLYDYEYTDCIAKKTDAQIFEEYYWNKYNESVLYNRLSNTYQGFDQNDWQTLLNWRSEIASVTCDQL